MFLLNRGTVAMQHCSLLHRYGENSSYTPILLELLTVIPEEVRGERSSAKDVQVSNMNLQMTDEKLKLSASRRKHLQERLKQNGAKIVALLVSELRRRYTAPTFII